MELYIVKTGFNSEDFIRITEEEVPIAIKAQVTGKVAVFKEGTVSGNNIISVTPDYHSMMGWNHGYKLQPEDFAEIAVSKECRGAKNYLSTIRQEIISGAKPKELPSDVKRLAASKRV